MKNSIIEEPIYDLIRPNIPPLSHPIEKGLYFIDTFEINKMQKLIDNWIQQRAPGGLIYGRPRLGKTHAIKYYMRLFPHLYDEHFPLFLINCRRYNRPNENTFFEDMLKDIGHGIPFSGKANIKRDRLFKFLLQKGSIGERNQVVILFDDAQRLEEIHYEWLMDIYNELDRYGISLTSILVGQEELANKRDAYLASKSTQIVGRFMIHEYKFSGIKNVQSLQYFLSGYDKATEFPVGTDWSYTRYYFPLGYSMGKRLENIAPELMDIFQKIRMEANLKKEVEIPMYFITSIVNYVFKKYGANGKDVEWPNISHWKEAIQSSGYLNFEVFNDVI